LEQYLFWNQRNAVLMQAEQCVQHLLNNSKGRNKAKVMLEQAGIAGALQETRNECEKYLELLCE